MSIMSTISQHHRLYHALSRISGSCQYLFYSLLLYYLHQRQKSINVTQLIDNLYFF